MQGADPLEDSDEEGDEHVRLEFSVFSPQRFCVYLVTDGRDPFIVATLPPGSLYLKIAACEY